MSAIHRIATTLALVLSGAVFAAEPVDVNSATAEALAEAIDGVGLKRAEAIVNFRDENGPFRSLDDLVQVRGIGERIVEGNRDNLTVGKKRK